MLKHFLAERSKVEKIWLVELDFYSHDGRWQLSEQVHDIVFQAARQTETKLIYSQQHFAFYIQLQSP